MSRISSIACSPNTLPERPSIGAVNHHRTSRGWGNWRCYTWVMRGGSTQMVCIFSRRWLRNTISCSASTDAHPNVVPWREPYMPNRDPRDYLPDVADGLTHRERVVLWCLKELQEERSGRHVPTGMLYGSVVEHVNMSVDEMQSILVRLIGHPIS